jgi:hypothetical protein
MLTNIILLNLVYLIYLGGQNVETNDAVVKPKHYTNQLIETIHILDDLALPRNLERSVEYIMRSEKKGGEEDIKKALFYLTRDLMIRHKTNKLEILKIVDGSIQLSEEYLHLQEQKNEKHIR